MTFRFARLAAAFVLVAWSLPAVEARADDTEDAIAFVQQGGQEMLDILSAPPGQARRDEFRRWLNANFDLDTLAGMALGSYAQSATPEQLSAYDEAFSDYIVVTYEFRFDAFSDYSFEVGRGRPLGDTDQVVRTQVIDPQGKAVVVDFRVRKQGGSFKVIDVAVEGLSMLKTQRDEFAAVIQRQGIDGLIDSLREHAAELMSASGTSSS